MAVSRDEVLHVARLARLRLSAADVGRFTHQLNDILRHVETLTDAEAGARQPPSSRPPSGGVRSPGPSAGRALASDTAVAPRPAPLRADEPGADALDRPPEALAAAWAGGFFILPRLPALDADAAQAQAADAAP